MKHRRHSILNIFKLAFLILFISFGYIARSFAGKETIRVLFINLGTNTMISSLQTHVGSYQIETIRVPMTKTNNPLNISNVGFNIGNSRVSDPKQFAPPPVADNLSWFDQYDPNLSSEESVRKNMPDILVISGHAIAGLGWHSDDSDSTDSYYLKNLYFPTLIETLRQNKGARYLFAHVKMAILGGCNTLVNFEPRNPTNNAFLTPEQISKIYYSANPAARQYVIGSPQKPNTLDFYRKRLASLYYSDFTLNKKEERCAIVGEGVAPDNCATLDLNRVLPDYGLFNKSHMYNYPYMWKRIMPEAVLILGFSGSSAYASSTKIMLLEALNDSLTEMRRRGLKLNDVITPLIDKSHNPVSVEEKKQIIRSIRKNWSLQTNRGLGRVGSSITPAFPDIDANGPFPDLSGLGISPSDAPPCAPYEDNPLTNCTGQLNLQ